MNIWKIIEQLPTRMAFKAFKRYLEKGCDNCPYKDGVCMFHHVGEEELCSKFIKGVKDAINHD